MAQPERNQQGPIGQAPSNTIHAARDVVSVACKMPNGLILRGMDRTIVPELVQGGGVREVVCFVPNGEQIVLGGTSARVGDPRPPLLTASGYRVTPNVPKQLWDDWYAANKNSDLVRNRIVFASEKAEDVQAFGRQHDTVVTGLEGIDPRNPQKHVRGIAPQDAPRQ
jgi:hypothetical protein